MLVQTFLVGGGPSICVNVRPLQEPAKGELCFPGGSLELGETLVECAVREIHEETGVRLRNRPELLPADDTQPISRLDVPQAITAVDAMMRCVPAGCILCNHRGKAPRVPSSPGTPKIGSGSTTRWSTWRRCLRTRYRTRSRTMMRMRWPG